MSKLDFTDPALLEALGAALMSAGVDGIEIEQSSSKLRLVVERQSPQARLRVQTHSEGPESGSDIVTAPMAGIFDIETVPGVLPRLVTARDILACLRVGPVLVPVRSSQACVVMRYIAAPNAIVGFGDPLFDTEVRS